MSRTIRPDPTATAIAAIEGFPILDGDEADMVLHRMGVRIDTLYHLAVVVLEGNSPHDLEKVLARAVESVENDWRHFRKELVEAVRHSADYGHIQNRAAS